MTDNILLWCKSVAAISPTRWFNLVQSVPLELLTARPAPNEWSALECLQHVTDVEAVSFPVRIKAILAGQPFPAFNPADRPPRAAPTVVLAGEFNELRQQTLALINQLTETDLEKQGLHAEYGWVTMSQLLHHIAAHDLNHLVQAERAIMQPFIKGSGPFSVNYTDHLPKISS